MSRARTSETDNHTCDFFDMSPSCAEATAVSILRPLPRAISVCAASGQRGLGRGRPRAWTGSGLRGLGPTRTRAWTGSGPMDRSEGDGRAQVASATTVYSRSEEHTSELQSRFDLVCRLLLEKKKTSSEERCRRNTATEL